MLPVSADTERCDTPRPHSRKTKHVKERLPEYRPPKYGQAFLTKDTLIVYWAEKIGVDPELAKGYNCIGFSQGSSQCHRCLPNARRDLLHTVKSPRSHRLVTLEAVNIHTFTEVPMEDLL